jgi:5-keto-L-gluconate epimerase
MVKSEKIKLSVAVAGENALPSAFVVFRGFEESVKKAAELGYNGVELALKNAAEINPSKLSTLLLEMNMEVSCISTGQVFSETGLMFTDADHENRSKVKRIFKQMIDLAGDFGQKVNIGRVRGSVGVDGRAPAERRFVEMARELCDYAIKKGVTLVLEPVNRYEINFINRVEEGVKLLEKVDRPNMKLMPDVFHMNIEDASMGEELANNIESIAYIHLADSNRLAPGWGHTDFDEIFRHLNNAGYHGWMAVEILPEPEPFLAAKQAISYLKPRIEKYNSE